MAYLNANIPVTYAQIRREYLYDLTRHHGDWPYGRTNHYYFDLNRDWFYLTQPETKGRVKLINEWRPQYRKNLSQCGIPERREHRRKDVREARGRSFISYFIFFHGIVASDADILA